MPDSPLPASMSASPPAVPRFLIMVFCSICLSPLTAIAGSQAVTVYAGKYSDSSLGEILVSKPISFIDSYMTAAALSQAYEFESPSHQWEIEGQVARHLRGQAHWELNLLAIYRWQRFPWNRFLRTSIAIGEGLSYATRVPRLEEEDPDNVGVARLLNYILIEATFAPPHADNWSLVVRVHHRSGVYGLFGGVEGGSNVIATGIKWYY